MKNAYKSFEVIVVLLAAFCLSAGVLAQTAAEPEFVPSDLDRLIEDSKPVRGVAVQMLTPPKQVQFEASIAALPETRKTHYLLEVLGVMGVKPLPEVTQGIDVVSPQKRPLNLYVEKTAAERIGRELQAGDKVTLFGYHVYDSKKHGPGILVSGFEVPSRIGLWQGRLSRWLVGQ